MDILIPNIEVDLSEQDLTIMSIHPDGRVLYTPLKGKNKGKMRLTKMVALPEHGRLIDATELEASDAILIGEDAWNMVHNAPTVLEANNG